MQPTGHMNMRQTCVCATLLVYVISNKHNLGQVNCRKIVVVMALVGNVTALTRYQFVVVKYLCFKLYKLSPIFLPLCFMEMQT